MNKNMKNRIPNSLDEFIIESSNMSKKKQIEAGTFTASCNPDDIYGGYDKYPDNYSNEEILDDIIDKVDAILLDTYYSEICPAPPALTATGVDFNFTHDAEVDFDKKLFNMNYLITFNEDDEIDALKDWLENEAFNAFKTEFEKRKIFVTPIKIINK